LANICSVGGCGGPAIKRGWCSAHYQRWRHHGDPLGGGTARGAAPEFLENALKNEDHHSCLLWPYSRDDYGYAKIKNGARPAYVHRIICERVHGKQPTSAHEAAHSCGNGHLGCINPHHLRWATPTANQKDRRSHGTALFGERHPSSKLSDAKVKELREAYAEGKASQRELSVAYGIAQGQVSRIVNAVRRAQ